MSVRPKLQLVADVNVSDGNIQCVREISEWDVEELAAKECRGPKFGRKETSFALT